MENDLKKTFEKTCKECGKKFTAMNVQKTFCSNACKTRDWKRRNPMNYLHRCEWCKKEFTSEFKKSRFCSHKCAGFWKHDESNLKKSFCIVCGKEFLAHHIKNKYCSSSCKQKNARKESTIIVHCSNCNKEYKRYKFGIGKNTFCSKECDIQFREKNADDTRICETCNKPFDCKKGDKLRFCSMSCQGIWQSKTRIKENHPSYKKEYPESKRVISCEYCGKPMRVKPYQINTKKYCSWSCTVKSMPKSMTSPHRKVLEILDEINSEYDVEVSAGRYSLDCKIKNSNLAIEVMGTYWHTDIRFYDEPVNDIQGNILHKDNKKKNFLDKEGYKVLYIWEDDIEKRYDVCLKLIKEFVRSCGTLVDYHSMNYGVVRGRLVLNKNILIPHFEK